MAVQYSDQGIFIPTEDLIRQYVPRLATIYEEHPEYKQGSTTPNGHSFGFPYIEEMYGLVRTPGPFMINTQWLEKVGKEMPTTIDEFVDCLRAMVAIADKCKYPEIVASLVNYCMDPEISITLNWGAVGYTYVKGDDGKLHFNLDENGEIILQNGWQYFSEQRNNTSPCRGSLAVLNEYYDQYVDYTWDAVPILEGQRVNGKEECLEEIESVPKMMMTMEENNKLSQIYGTIANIVNAYQMDAVMNGTDDAGWDKFKEDLKAAGVDELVSTYQQAYERFCSFGK